MRNKNIQNTNVQTNTKMQRKDDRQTDRQTDRHMLRKFYSNLLGNENSIIYNSKKSYITHSSIYIG